MELCKLLIGNIDLKTGRVEVKHGVIGGAKGGKGRTVYLGKTTRQSGVALLVDREDANDPDAPVFLDQHGRHFNPGSLRQLIKDIADRAEVKDAYPHKFRHTFAITYLRSGGDIFTLQALLGHSSWTWCATMPRSPRWISPRRITKPARQIIGGCENLISNRISQRT